MINFLHSIGIDNADDFDMDFEALGRSRFDHDQWDIVIVKDKPWKYHLLRQFQDGLSLVKYRYVLTFSYKVRPDSEDATALFDDWYKTIYHIPHNLILSIKDDTKVVVEYASKSEMEQSHAIIQDFRDFLTFLCYEVEMEETVVEEDAPVVSKKEMKKITKNAVEEANASLNEEPITEITDSSDVQQAIEEEKRDMNAKVEDALLEIMKQNAIEMKRERERMRLNKRGKYVPIDSIDSINENSDHIDFDGTVFSYEEVVFGEKRRITVGVNDKLGGCIYVGGYESASINADTIKGLVRGANVRVRGVAYYDEYSKAVTVKAHYIDLLPPEEIEKEEYELNRVELHLHSNMSSMDGIGKMEEYCRYAAALGHKAISITDHGVVQGFPEAQKYAKKTGVKMIYGSELYMVDDQLKYVKNPSDVILKDATFVLLDLETTGLSSKYNDIIEFGAVRVEHGSVTSRLDILINPGYPIPKKIVELTDITDALVKDAPSIKEAMPRIIDFIGDAIVITHNADFDFSFLQENLKKLELPLLQNPVIDTLALSRYLFPESHRHSLGALCKNMDVVYDEDDAHRADYDAKVLSDVWLAMEVLLTKNNPLLKHSDLAKLETPKALLKHIRPSHVVVLVKEKAGIKDLYKIISKSHVDYLAEVPKIPRRELEKYREHLLIGSACFNGEIFNTARYYNDEEIKRLMTFYDYIEIQPLANYSYLVNMGDLTNEELLKYIKDIVRCADELGKPVVATSDCHYVRKEDRIFRDVYVSAKGLGGTLHPMNPYARNKLPPFENPDQHYRTTKEMLEEMSFLGEEKAYEVTVKNTNMIADEIEDLKPVPNDVLYTPKIDNCENMLRDMCFKRAHELYGDPLPEVIQKRLDTELNGIIGNGYSVIYYIAHKIVKKTEEDGYIVGSRGSVGSSLVATMAGITEVNPLAPHYLCPHCHHLEWTSETMPEYKSGYDLPDKVCPVCGEKMIHDGQNIPFETFLGFSAEKTPDIDLNFPGDYQARAHDYTKVLLGADNVFRAGTIETVQEKTAFGFARGYIERQFISQGYSQEEAKRKADNYSKAKISYLAAGCVEVKRTTGQHPGGIIVIPRDHDVYDFTPVQFPADDIQSNWKTTHFDFRSIHDTVLKLDLLGHVDPMALKMMCDLTHIAIKDIPMNDEKVISLFYKPDALNMQNDYTGAKTGALAIPEFGTEFVRGILEVTKPKTFADLVIISGISHGTAVWQGNAEKLIEDGQATLRDVIGCRDDIMTYLISKGLPASVSFSIMEDVRHGKGLKPEYVEIMKANKVPDYYINSCNKIQYLFPKGHAVAYVTMAIRVGYFKIYHPLEFYATFFSTRSKQYDIVTMIKGREAIISQLEELKIKSRTKGEKLSPKEAEQYKTLCIALEMVQRGYHFANIDLYKSDPLNFVVNHEDNSLYPPFITIDGLGESNAITVKEEREKAPFSSIEDLLRRTKLTTTNVKDLTNMGVLDELDESDQLTLF